MSRNRTIAKVVWGGDMTIDKDMTYLGSLGFTKPHVLKFNNSGFTCREGISLEKGVILESEDKKRVTISKDCELDTIKFTNGKLFIITLDDMYHTYKVDSDFSYPDDATPHLIGEGQMTDH